MGTAFLERFIEAHRQSYEIALKEVKSGKKSSHWMWYIFPQIYGLGKSSTSQYYAIKSMDEAVCFLDHPIVGFNLREISNALLALESNDAREIFGKPDDMKLKSSMTLFSVADSNGNDFVFRKVLDKFFGGKPDKRTLFILSNMKQTTSEQEK